MLYYICKKKNANSEQDVTMEDINMKINMKRVGITFSRYQKELEKLNNQLERAKEAYNKKYANAAKYGVQDWDSIEYCEWLETTERTESDSLINKADVNTINIILTINIIYIHLNFFIFWVFLHFISF